MNNKQFAFPVSMIVTQEQFNFLSKELEKLGYENNGQCTKRSNPIVLYTNAGLNNNQYSSVNLICGEAKTIHDRYFIEQYNPELFLALAAQTTNEELAIGDYIKLRNGYIGDNKIEQIVGFHYNNKMKIGGREEQHCNPKEYEKATKEEIISHFINNKTNNMACNNNKEIIGYIAPYDINSMVHSGTIYIADTHGYYCPQGKEGDGSCWYLPAQIVEQWKAVYKSNEKRLTIPYELGSLGVVIKEIDRFTVDGEGTFSIPDLRGIVKKGNIQTLDIHSVRIDTISIGCKKGIKFSDVELVIKEHDILFK